MDSKKQFCCTFRYKNSRGISMYMYACAYMYKYIGNSSGNAKKVVANQ